MIAQCKICNKELANGYGTEIADGAFICDTTDCAEFAIGVVEAARAVVARFADVALGGDSQYLWWEIERLRETLAE